MQLAEILKCLICQKLLPDTWKLLNWEKVTENCKNVPTPNQSSFLLPKNTLDHSLRNERTGLLIAALKDCHAMVVSATPRAIIPASMNIAGPMVIR